MAFAHASHRFRVSTESRGSNPNLLRYAARSSYNHLVCHTDTGEGRITAGLPDMSTRINSTL